jgi:O-antigen/teichoic acid export membrane protein
MSVRRALAWLYSGQLLTFAINFAAAIVVARLLSPHDMGIFAIAGAMTSVIGILSTLGIGHYVVRASDLSPSTIDSAFTINAFLSCLIALFVYLSSFAGERLLDERAVGNVLAVLALGPLIGVFEFRPSTMLQREMHFMTIAVIGTLRTAINNIVVVSFAYAGERYMSMAYGAIAAGLFGVIAINLAAPHHVSLRLSMAEWKPMLTFGLRIMSISGVANLASRLSDIILGRLLGLEALGLYSRAAGMSNQIFENVYGAATRVMFVKLAADFREHGSLRETFLRGLAMITSLLWPIMIGLAVLARPAIYILYGEKWLPSALPLSLLMIAQFVVLCFGMNWELFVLRDETARQTRFEFIRAFVGIVTFSAGCFFNIAAAAVGRIAEAIFGFMLYRSHVRRLAETQPGELRRIYFNSLLLTVAAVMPSMFLMIYSGWSHLTPPWLIAAAILAGAGLWIVVLVRLKHPLWAEIKLAANRLGLP